jgi:hypothetical protein
MTQVPSRRVRMQRMSVIFGMTPPAFHHRPLVVGPRAPAASLAAIDARPQAEASRILSPIAGARRPV